MSPLLCIIYSFIIHSFIHLTKKSTEYLLHPGTVLGTGATEVNTDEACAVTTSVTSTRKGTAQGRGPGSPEEASNPVWAIGESRIALLAKEQKQNLPGFF